MKCHNRKVHGIHLTIAVDISGHDRLTPWLTEVGFAGFGGPAVGAHVDSPAVGERLVSDGAVRVPGVDTRTCDFVSDPAFGDGVPAARLGFQVVVTLDEEIVVGIIRCAVRVPVAGIGE